MKKLMVILMVLLSTTSFGQWENKDVKVMGLGFSYGHSNNGFNIPSWQITIYNFILDWSFLNKGDEYETIFLGEHYSTINWDERQDEMIREGQLVFQYRFGLGYNYHNFIGIIGIETLELTPYRTCFNENRILGDNGYYYKTLNSTSQNFPYIELGYSIRIFRDSKTLWLYDLSNNIHLIPSISFGGMTGTSFKVGVSYFLNYHE